MCSENVLRYRLLFQYLVNFRCLPVVYIHLDACVHACRCSVLAAANPSFGSFDDTQDSSEQHEFKATILSR